ncbi:predicted protein [Lichtheimia corymbifera JMRC:FSU:9682]|uniref:Uncharacterized protein n=1 Tax=Lichtheimia corymbifera JMRC:FSU:9682 TaxID=1263082 RepID=A0A068SC43_9FUNG|nr:predicted protein [Lichtheimia corymbifera JMRC:FSU:9682]
MLRLLLVLSRFIHRSRQLLSRIASFLWRFIEQQHNMDGMETRFFFEGRTLLRITTSPIQMHPLTTVAACGSTAQVVPKSADEGLIWVTVKFGVLAPCFLREGANSNELSWIHVLRSTAMIAKYYWMGLEKFVYCASFIGESCHGQGEIATLSTSWPYYIVRWFRYHLLYTSFYLHLKQQATTSISFGVVKVYLVRLWFWSSTILLMDIQLRVPVIGGSYQQLAQETTTMSNRIHTLSVNNIYSILWIFIIGQLLSSRALCSVRLLWVCHISNKLHTMFVCLLVLSTSIDRPRQLSSSNTPSS